jgi:DNA-binding NarL/FixJ family response regulator
MDSPQRRLLLVEDEPLVSSLLKEALENSGFEVKTASSAIEATKMARSFDPDIGVLDINLGHGASGVDLAFILHNQYPGIALVLLTKHPDLRTAGFSDADVPDGCGFIRKDMIGDSRSVVAAIEEVIAHKEQVRHDIDPLRPLGVLTATQVEVLRMVAQGFTNQEIARRRTTSIRAVEQMMTTVFNALEIEVDGPINPRVEAVRRFITIAGTPERT